MNYYIMVIILTISLLICMSYVIITKICFNENSISESYYYLEDLKKGSGSLLFLGWCFLSGVSLFPIWLECTPDNMQFVLFLSVSSLIFTGAFPKYLTDHNVRHYVLAGVCLGLSLLWGFLIGLWLIPLCLIIPTIIYCLIKKKEDLFYWVEVAGIVSIYTELYYKMLIG